MFVSPHLKCFLSENIRNVCRETRVPEKRQTEIKMYSDACFRTFKASLSPADL